MWSSLLGLSKKSAGFIGPSAYVVRAQHRARAHGLGPRPVPTLQVMLTPEESKTTVLKYFRWMAAARIKPATSELCGICVTIMPSETITQPFNWFEFPGTTPPQNATSTKDWPLADSTLVLEKPLLKSVKQRRQYPGHKSYLTPQPHPITIWPTLDFFHLPINNCRLSDFIGKKWN